MKKAASPFEPVIAVIQARCASTRFPNKVLEKINGRSLLVIMIERLKRSKTLDKVVIATTGAPADDAIAAECAAIGVPVFRGSERDVLDRYYRAAKENGAGTVVRIVLPREPGQPTAKVRIESAAA